MFLFLYHRRQSLEAVEILFATSIDQSDPDEWPVVGEVKEREEKKHMKNTDR